MNLRSRIIRRGNVVACQHNVALLIDEAANSESAYEYSVYTWSKDARQTPHSHSLQPNRLVLLVTSNHAYT